MNNLHKPLRTIVNTAVLSILSASAAHAGSFALYTESSPAAIGNYAAGVAAEAADASTGWYNPAGLPLLHKQQITFGGAGVFPSSKLTGTSDFTTVTTLPAPLPPISTSYTQAFSGIQGAENAFVPSVHYALPLGENAAFGFSIVSPFGLSTDWDSASPVRYQATRSELITANFSPELGAKITNNFSLGAGLDLQYARVEFNRMIGIPTFLLPFDVIGINPDADDSLSYNKGKSFGVGYHVGIMGMFNDNHTRLGLNYQSKMRHKFNGYSQFSGPLATPNANLFINPVSGSSIILNNNLTSNAIQFPDVLTLSAYHDLNEKIAFLGSVVYTGWSCFDSIQLNNVAAPNVNVDILVPSASVNQVSLSSTTLENYKNAWRAAIGANYKFNDALMLRVGGGYDQTPTVNAYRDVRLPDADRWALSVGAHYQARANIGVDLGYTHLFAANNPTINNTEVLAPGSTYNVTAVGSVSADLVGAQIVWAIDQPAAMPMPTK